VGEDIVYQVKTHKIEEEGMEMSKAKLDPSLHIF
jgi:hypothetical protein